MLIIYFSVLISGNTNLHEYGQHLHSIIPILTEMSMKIFAAQSFYTPAETDTSESALDSSPCPGNVWSDKTIIPSDEKPHLFPTENYKDSPPEFHHEMHGDCFFLQEVFP